jgi:predicted phosphodiesterase
MNSSMCWGSDQWPVIDGHMDKILDRWIRQVLLALLLALILLVGWHRLMVTWSRPLTTSLTRGPYLQSVTPDSVIVVWETDAPGDSRVDYGPTASYGLVVSDVVSVTHHALTLTGLSPYTTFHYRVSTDGQLFGEDSAFRTAAPLTQTTFSFVVYGDTRTNVTPHQQVVNRIRALAPDFVLHTGDFVDDGGSPGRWTTFFTIEQDLIRQAPLFGVLGNHENDSPYYFDVFHFPGNERWYSFDYGNVHFVALEVDGSSDYAPGSEQAVWLENDLAHTGQLWKIVFFHVPPYSSGSHGGDTSVRNALEPVFTRYGVDLVFNGHDHDYERSVANGIVYIVAGGGGAPLYGKENSNPASVCFTSTYHAVSISATDSLLTIAGVRPDGLRFDESTLYKLHHFMPIVIKRR